MESASGFTLTRKSSSRERAIGLDCDGPVRANFFPEALLSFWASIAPLAIKTKMSDISRRLPRPEEPGKRLLSFCMFRSPWGYSSSDRLRSSQRVPAYWGGMEYLFDPTSVSPRDPVRFW